MSRSSAAEFSHRVNQAFQLLEQKRTPAEIVARFAQLGVSPRQAARYLQCARKQSQPLAIAEAKEVFTVKLPRGLVQKVRHAAHLEKCSISDWVARGLAAQLRRHSPHG